MNTRAALYCRVSTDRQENQNQEAELTAYASRRGWVEPAIFCDVVSGVRDTRPALDSMLQACRAGLVDTVAVVKLDRLGRSLIHLATLLAEFTRLRVALVCTSQGIDTTADNPVSRFQLQVLGAVAEFERSLIVERVRAGQKRARAQGKHLGRAPLDLALLPRAAALKQEGKTLRQISAALGVSLGSAFKLTQIQVAPAQSVELQNAQ